MLILVRKVQQSIWIEGNIHVKILSVERDRVKLGITAPDDVKVMREELFGDGGPAGPEAPDAGAAGRANGQHKAAS
jgi:carbon storage regulator CsrA